MNDTHHSSGSSSLKTNNEHQEEMHQSDAVIVIAVNLTYFCILYSFYRLSVIITAGSPCAGEGACAQSRRRFPCV